jgi:tyrosyl-tRNA synthetase
VSDARPTTRDSERAAAKHFIHLPKLIADEFQVSTSEARRLIAQGGVKIDGSTPLSFDYPASSLSGKTLTVGKRQRVEL